jgi:hypothetical protein
MTLPRSISTHNPWIYEDKEVTSDTLAGFYGFVYIIVDRETGKKYIGRKYIWSYRKEKGSSRRKKKESDWQDYYSSNEDLKQIGKENPGRLKREILHLCKSKGETNWKELDEIIKRNALWDENYFNENLLGKYFRKNVEKYYK